jgi:hypothetical protein
MNHIIKYKLFENNSEITYNDVAWLYFLKWVYNGKMSIKDWKEDKRMNGQNCDESLKKFNCVKITDIYYLASDDCNNIIDKYFGAKTFEDAVRKSKDFYVIKTDSIWNRNYTIDKIPLELYLKKNPNIDKAFDTITNRITLHYNSQISDNRILTQLANSRRIKEFNFMKWFNSGLPENFTVYRGIKSEYNKNYENHLKYTCWTTSLKEAERFAKYEFTGYRQFEPIYAKHQNILVADINISDVKVFIGGEESEIILQEPVKIKDIIKLK